MRAPALLLVLLSFACGGPSTDAANRPVAVQVEPITRGPVSERRQVPGTLESPARMVVATRTSGRVATMDVDLDERVSNGQVVATLDRDEYQQAVRQAEAALAMAQARLTEARAQARLAVAEAGRTHTLFDRQAASGSEQDRAVATSEAASASVQVAQAAVSEARAALETARARLDEATLRVSWAGDDATRVVAARYVDEGTIVPSGTALVEVVDLDPLRAVVSVTDRDAPRLSAGLPVTLTSDALPGERFGGTVSAVAPVFDPASRQARVEIAVPNRDGRLRPGQFVQVEIVLQTQQDATLVPAQALVRRDERDAVFVVPDGGTTATLVPVQVGLRDGEQVQVTADGLTGQVVVLGQQRLSDGSPVRVSGAPAAEAAP